MNDLTPHPILIAFSTVCKSDFADGVEFSAPSNWKDEEKIAREIARKKEKFALEAKDYMLTGVLQHVIAVSPFTENIFNSSEMEVAPDDANAVAVLFAHWLTEQVTSDESPVLVGFDAKVAGRLTMFGSLREVACPVEWWKGKTTIGIDSVDPMEVLVETAELRTAYGPVKLLRQMGVAVHDDYVPHNLLQDDLQYAATLGVNLGVLGDGHVLELLTPEAPEAPAVKAQVKEVETAEEAVVAK